ncbi:MAG: S8 family peptidase [Bacteroidales bacterium]|nr:S8 family peptidase [Bacteroidales bacterium]
MKKHILTFIFICLSTMLMAQQISPNCYRIYLSDKDNNPFTIQNPSEYLSARALEKRARFNIAITEQDLPITPQYKQQLQSVDPSIRLLAESKWVNTVTLYCPDSTKIDQIAALSFVDSILPVAFYDPWLMSIDPISSPTIPPYQEPIVATRDSILEQYNYGEGYAQIAIHNGHLLHNDGFRGEGMLIAVFDAGWDHMDSIEIFNDWYNNQLVGTRDLIPFRNNVFLGHQHGTLVTSSMCNKQEGSLVGTAPEASYFLIRSEEPASEQLIEEDFWAYAAEIADSIGADVINSSLGYCGFPDFPQASFGYEQVDGVSSIASLAATTLGQKGVVVCVSAGNEGTSEWYHIGHPADAYDILSVAAVGIDSVIGAFSSRGPSYDGRIKPDIASVGVNTLCVYPDPEYNYFYGYASGTSLAGPVAAGLCACLWQSLPAATSQQIMQYVRESGSCANNPNNDIGYGIPDFYAAYTSHTAVPVYKPIAIEVWPNPCTNQLYISNNKQEIQTVQLYSANGNMVRQLSGSASWQLSIPMQDLPAGLYLGKVSLGNGASQHFKVVKQ